MLLLKERPWGVILFKRNIKTLDSDKEVALLYKKPTKKFLHYLKKICLSVQQKAKK